MVFDEIEVTFMTPDSEFSRRPIGHTCGRILEVPDSYKEFVHLREDFDSVLESEIWVMDIK